VLGPAIVAMRDGLPEEVAGLCWTVTIAQAIGVALLVSGYARRARMRRRLLGQDRGFALLPTGPGTPAGVTLAARF